MRVDRFYDLQCSDCGRWRSTDFQYGMDTSKEHLIRNAEAEGWGYKNRVGNLCPVCNKKMNLMEFIRRYQSV